MKAAIVTDFSKPPHWGDMEKPTAGPGEVLVKVHASCVTNLVKMVAAGKHYTSVAQFPFAPGFDGIGVVESAGEGATDLIGKRIYFAAPRFPFGGLGEYSVAKKVLTALVPDDIDDITAAAVPNPAMSSWAALELRAKIQKGETVLINGSTGAAGSMALKIAQHLGASKIVVTGRNKKALDELVKAGASEAIVLEGEADALKGAFIAAIKKYQIDIVLDYIWGPSAEAILGAIAAIGSDHRIRFVQIGSMAGNEINLSAFVLRSTGVEILGSGLGSVPLPAVVGVIGKALSVTKQLNLDPDVRSVPISEVESQWNAEGKRAVFVFP